MSRHESQVGLQVMTWLSGTTSGNNNNARLYANCVVIFLQLFIASARSNYKLGFILNILALIYYCLWRFNNLICGAKTSTKYTYTHRSVLLINNVFPPGRYGTLIIELARFHLKITFQNKYFKRWIFFNTSHWARYRSICII